MKKILFLITSCILVSSCSPSADTDIIDKTLESSSKSLGNVSMVNDITKQGQQNNDVNQDIVVEDVKLGSSDQQAVKEVIDNKDTVTPIPKNIEKNPIDRDTTTLQAQDKTIGTGVEAVSGKQVAVHYVGKLINGNEFDNSLKRGEPIVFTLGSGQVIKGWDVGIEGMKVGGKRHLVIPPQLAYGDNSPDPSAIPNGATLIFDVELVDVK